MEPRVKVLVVDDSKLIRTLIGEIFNETGKIQVVGEAGNGAEALNLLPVLNPDVVTLDVNMPVMDGLTALKHIMVKHPTPTVMLSSYTREGEQITFDALKYGAIDFITKPSQFQTMTLLEQRRTMIEKVTAAAKVQLEAVHYLRAFPKESAQKQIGRGPCQYVFAFGASVGGYRALLKIIPQLDPDLSSAFLASVYTASDHLDAFIRYLDKNSAIQVKRAVNGDILERGICYMATADDYVTVFCSEAGLELNVHPNPFPAHQGAINMLMFSLAEAMKQRAAGVILSGSGEDGVEGLGEILRVGGIGIIQDPLSCLSQRTACSAIDRCHEALILSDSRIASEINRLLISSSGEKSQ